MPAKISLSVDFVEKLSKIMREQDLHEVELEEGETRIFLRRGGVSAPPPVAMPAFSSAPEASASVPLDISTSQGPGVVTSPMVGTAYLAPSPGSKAFVKKGDPVREGQALLLIEAMKVMNQITSPVGGVVQDIHVGDAQPVEFGEVLVTVKPG